MQEELASPEPLRHVGELCPLTVTDQDDTENVPPPDDSRDMPEIYSARPSCPDEQTIEPWPQAQPVVATPSQCSLTVPQRSKDSVLNTNSNIPLVLDGSSTTPSPLVDAAPALAAHTPIQQHGSGHHAAAQPSTGYPQCFHRDSIWSCESEEQHHTSASAAEPGPAETSSLVKNTQRRSKVSAVPAAESNSCRKTESAAQSLVRASVTSSEAAMFRSATDLSVGTPSEVFTTPTGGARVTPLGATTTQHQVDSAGTRGPTANLSHTDSLLAEHLGLLHELQPPDSVPDIAAQASEMGASPDVARLLHTPSDTATPPVESGVGARGDSTTPPIEASSIAEISHSQTSACINSGMLEQAQGSCNTLHTPAPIHAHLLSEGSLKQSQATSAAYSAPVVSGGAASQPVGAHAFSTTAQPSARPQQDCNVSPSAQPASSVAPTRTSQKLTPASSAQQILPGSNGSAGASKLHAAGDAPLHATPPSQAPEQSGAEPVSAASTKQVSTPSRRSASPAASAGISASRHSHDAPEYSAEHSCAVPSESVPAQSQPSARHTRSTTRRTGSASAKLSSGTASLAVPLLGATGSQQPLQGITGTATHVDRRSIVDATHDPGTHASLALCTPPNIPAVASSTSSIPGAAKASPVVPGDSADARPHSMAQPAAYGEIVAVSDAGCMEESRTSVQAADSSAGAAPRTASRKCSTGSQGSSAAAHPHTRPTPQASGAVSAESSSVGYPSQSASSVRDPSYTPEVCSADAADTAPATRIATRLSMRVAQNPVSTAACARASGRTDQSEGSARSRGTGSTGSHATPQRADSEGPVVSESTDYGPPPPTAPRSTAATRMFAQRSGVVAPLAFESADHSPPAPAAACTGDLGEAPMPSADRPAACPSTQECPVGSQLFSQTLCESQWTLSGINNDTRAQDFDDGCSKGQSQSWGCKEQPNIASMPQRRMSLAIAGRASCSASKAAASSLQLRPSISGQKPHSGAPIGAPAEAYGSPAAAAPDVAASRDAIAASSATPSGPSSCDVIERASIVRRALRNSLAASVATPASAAPSPSSQHLPGPAVQPNAASTVLAVPATTAATGRPPRHPVAASETLQKLSEAKVATGTPTSEPHTGARKAPTPIPSRRDQKRLKARASMIFTTAPAQHRIQGTYAIRAEQAVVSGSGGGPPVTPHRSISTASMKPDSGAAGSRSAHPSPQPRTALLTTLLARRASFGQQGVADIAVAGTPPQTPPSLPGCAPGGHASGGGIARLAGLASRQSIMPDPSPIREESEHSGTVSTPEPSVVEVAADGTPVAQAAVRPAAAGSASAAPRTPHSSQASGACAGVAAHTTASMQPLSTPLSCDRQHADAVPLQEPSAHASVVVPSAGLAETQGPVVQRNDSVSYMSESSADTLVRADGATGVEMDDEASDPLTAIEELLMLCNQVCCCLVRPVVLMIHA